MPGILLAIGWFTLLLWLLRRTRLLRLAPGLSPSMAGWLFALKALAGTAVWAVYTYAYPDRGTADIFKYFDDSRVMHEALWTRPGDYLRMLFGIGNDTPWFTDTYYSHMNHWVRRWDSGLHNDAHTMIRFNAVLRLVSFGHYHVHTVFAAAISTWGSLACYRALAARTHELKRGLLFSVFLWPSVLFWSSGVLKECLLMAGLGYLLFATIGSWRPEARWLRPIVIAGCVALLLLVKVYVLFCLIPPMIAFQWCRWRPEHAIKKYSAVLVAVIGGAMLVGAFVPRADVLYILAMKQQDFVGLTREVPTGSAVVLPVLEPSLISFMANAPHALVNAFLSPFKVLGRGPLAGMGALESLLLVVLPLLALWKRRAWRAMDAAALLFALSFIMLLALLIGWTVPVVGALVRYRVPMLPFVGWLACLIVDPERLPTSIRKLLN